MISKEPLIGWIILVLILILSRSRRIPAAIVALVAGIALNFILHPDLSLPQSPSGYPFRPPRYGRNWRILTAGFSWLPCRSCPP